MPEAIKVYTNPISTNSKRVRVLAKEMDIPTEDVLVDFSTAEHKRPEFLAMNPNGKLPVVEIGGRNSWESPAILIELAQQTGSDLYPPPGPEQTEVLKWMFWNASHLEPPIFAAVFEVVFKPQIPGAEFDQARFDLAEADFRRFAGVLNEQLSDKPWIIGQTFTIADIAIGTTAEVAEIGRLPVDAFPHLSRWLGRLSAREHWGPQSLAA